MYFYKKTCSQDSISIPNTFCGGTILPTIMLCYLNFLAR
jgi:hypothetical protein